MNGQEKVTDTSSFAQEVFMAITQRYDLEEQNTFMRQLREYIIEGRNKSLEELTLFVNNIRKSLEQI